MIVYVKKLIYIIPFDYYIIPFDQQVSIPGQYVLLITFNPDTYVFYITGLSTARDSHSGISHWSQVHTLRHFDSHCCHTHLQTF